MKKIQTTVTFPSGFSIPEKLPMDGTEDESLIPSSLQEIVRGALQTMHDKAPTHRVSTLEGGGLVRTHDTGELELWQVFASIVFPPKTWAKKENSYVVIPGTCARYNFMATLEPEIFCGLKFPLDHQFSSIENVGSEGETRPYPTMDECKLYILIDKIKSQLLTQLALWRPSGKEGIHPAPADVFEHALKCSRGITALFELECGFGHLRRELQSELDHEPLMKALETIRGQQGLRFAHLQDRNFRDLCDLLLGQNTNRDTPA